MANPSTTGSGTEVIRRFFYDGFVESAVTLLTVPANHIYIVKPIIFADRSAEADSILHLYVEPDGGSQIEIGEFSCGSGETFVFSDTLTLTATDVLKAWGSSAAGTAAYDCIGTFIDQDWS